VAEKGFRIAGAFVDVKLDDQTGEGEAKLREKFARAKPIQINAKVDVDTKRAEADLNRVSLTGGRVFSPLVAAGIAAGSILGGPLALGAVPILFGGIAAAVLAKNREIKEDFTRLGEGIVTDLQADTRPLVPYFRGIASDISTQFQGIRPQLRAIFGDLGPEVQTVTSGVLDLAHNAMPGFTNAVHNAQPVMQGISDLLAKTGTGLTGFLNEISDGMPGAATVLNRVGDVIEQILPIAGHLLSFLSQTASGALPVFSSSLLIALTLLDKLLTVLGPIAPELGTIVGVALSAAGAFKLMGVLAGPLDKLGTSLAGVAANGGVMAGAAGKAESAASSMGKALPILGVAVVAVDLIWQKYVTSLDDGTTAMLAGGKAAADMKAKVDDQLTGFGKWLNGMLHVVATSDDMTASMNKQLAAMDPLTRAQTLAKQAQADYSSAVERFGPLSTQATSATARFATQTAEVTKQQNLLKTGLESTTDALKRQEDQVMGAVEADIKYGNSLKAATDAAKANGRTIDLNTESGRKNQQALIDLARAARDDTDAMTANGATTNQVSASEAQHRQQLIQVAQQMGFTRDQAQRLTDKYLAVPTRIDTNFAATTIPAVGAVQRMASDISHILATIGDEQVLVRFAGDTGNILNRATGGPVQGPGSESSDSIPARLSHNEHVWTAAEVRGAGGHAGVGMLRKMAASGRLPGFAAGGPVLANFASTGTDQVEAANAAYIRNALQGMVGYGRYMGGGSLEGWIQAALGLTHTPQSWDGPLHVLISRESGGNPNAINLTDSNARAGHPSQGLMQTIPGTFRAYHQAGTSWSITDPVANISAGINYIKARYGSIFNVQQANPNAAPRGYDAGGLLPPGATTAVNRTGRPERVLNATQTAKLDRLLSGAGSGLTVNVTQVSGSPAETGRFVALALRTVG
jgi:hypothetical protein